MKGSAATLRSCCSASGSNGTPTVHALIGTFFVPGMILYALSMSLLRCWARGPVRGGLYQASCQRERGRERERERERERREAGVLVPAARRSVSWRIEV